MSGETFIPAREAARRLGVKTGTLARWRYAKKGPAGWIKLSETLVVYPEAGLEAWKAERAAAPPSPGFRRSAGGREGVLTEGV